MSLFNDLRPKVSIFKTVFNALSNWSPIRQLSLIESQKSLNEALLNRSKCQDEQALIISNMILNKRRLESAKHRYLYLVNNERLNEHYYEELKMGLGAKLICSAVDTCGFTLWLKSIPYCQRMNRSLDPAFYFGLFGLILVLCVLCRYIIQRMNWRLSCWRGYCAFVKPFFKANEVPEQIEDNCIKPALLAFCSLMTDKRIKELTFRTHALSIFGCLLFAVLITLDQYKNLIVSPGSSNGVQIGITVCLSVLFVLSLLSVVSAIFLWMGIYQSMVVETEKRLKSGFPWYNPRIDGRVTKKESAIL